jgi:hypothetical protein
MSTVANPLIAVIGMVNSLTAQCFTAPYFMSYVQFSLHTKSIFFNRFSVAYLGLHIAFCYFCESSSVCRLVRGAWRYKIRLGR